jgi:hypothetical protein
MTHTAYKNKVTDGSDPHFYQSGPITFSSLGEKFKLVSTGTEVKASELLRDTRTAPVSGKLQTDPIVPDATENIMAARPSSDDVSTYANLDLRLEDFRNSIKYYDIRQSGTEIQTDIENLSWNGNLHKSIVKLIDVTGIYASDNPTDPALELNGTANNLTIKVNTGGKIYGSAGRGSISDDTGSGRGGDAIKLVNTSTTGNKVVVHAISNADTSRIWAGGGAGGKGANGKTGRTVMCNKNNSYGDEGTEVVFFEKGGDCQCEYYSDCYDKYGTHDQYHTDTSWGINCSLTTYASNSSGRKRESYDNKYKKSNKANGGCACNWFYCRKTCIKRAYCIQFLAKAYPGTAGTAGTNGGDGQGWKGGSTGGTTDRQTPSIGAQVANHSCNSKGNGKQGAAGGEGGVWGEPGLAGLPRSSDTQDGKTTDCGYHEDNQNGYDAGKSVTGSNYIVLDANTSRYKSTPDGSPIGGGNIYSYTYNRYTIPT